MLFIFLLFFVHYCVYADEASNYYVIRAPIEDLPAYKQTKQFNVYWNVPTKQCKSKRIPFLNLYENFGIIQNSNDSFRGERISILYDPGNFPALLKDEKTGKLIFRNGGVPQEGDLSRHLETFRKVLDESVPDPNFDGVGIIDFESWRPIYRQNFGVLLPYKDVSYEIERKRHWFWSKNMLIAEATRRFEESAVLYMDSTLKIAKQLRPHAKWGYYAYPYCFNMAGKSVAEGCPDIVKRENDRMSWLWSESSVLYPSLYASRNHSTEQIIKMMRGRITEASRVNKNGAPILPYFWYRYREGGFLSDKDLMASLDTLYKSNASGFIIWGSSNDVNNKDKCLDLLDYVNSVLGPAIAKYTKRLNDNDFTEEESNDNDKESPGDVLTQVINELGTSDNTTEVEKEKEKENSLIDLLVSFIFKNSDDLVNSNEDSNSTDVESIASSNKIVLVDRNLTNKEVELDREVFEVDDANEPNKSNDASEIDTKNKRKSSIESDMNENNKKEIPKVLNNSANLDLNTTSGISELNETSITKNERKGLPKSNNNTQPTFDMKTEKYDTTTEPSTSEKFETLATENVYDETVTYVSNYKDENRLTDKTTSTDSKELNTKTNVKSESSDKNLRKGLPKSKIHKHNIEDATDNVITKVDAENDINTTDSTISLIKNNSNIVLEEITTENKQGLKNEETNKEIAVMSSALEKPVVNRDTKGQEQMKHNENNKTVEQHGVYSQEEREVLEAEMFRRTMESEQISKSSAVKRTDFKNQKFFVCAMYFYSIGKCLCYVFGQCE